MTGEKIVNGLNVDNLESTVNAINEKPDIAKFKFRATNKWVNGGHNRTTVKDFYGACQEDIYRTKPFVLDADEPPVLLGENQGANPVEYVLTALAGCVTTSLVALAAARGIKLHEVESKLEGDLDVRGFLGLSDEVRNGYQNIRVKFKVKGDAPPEKLRELVELAKTRSPVFDIVANKVPISVELEN